VSSGDAVAARTNTACPASAVVRSSDSRIQGEEQVYSFEHRTRGILGNFYSAAHFGSAACPALDAGCEQKNPPEAKFNTPALFAFSECGFFYALSFILWIPDQNIRG